MLTFMVDNLLLDIIDKMDKDVVNKKTFDSFKKKQKLLKPILDSDPSFERLWQDSEFRDKLRAVLIIKTDLDSIMVEIGNYTRLKKILYRNKFKTLLVKKDSLLTKLKDVYSHYHIYQAIFFPEELYSTIVDWKSYEK